MEDQHQQDGQPTDAIQCRDVLCLAGFMRVGRAASGTGRRGRMVCRVKPGGVGTEIRDIVPALFSAYAGLSPMGWASINVPILPAKDIPPKQLAEQKCG